MKTVIVLLSIVALALAQSASQCGNTPVPPDESRIVGGHPAKPYSWPWQAEMCFGNSLGSCSLRCGGSIIDENWIMCASHCVDGYVNQPGRFHMKVGTYDYHSMNETGEVIVDVTQVVMHPMYGKPHQYAHDMSLLKLKTPLKWTDHIQPVCLPVNEDDLLVEGKPMIVTGWGATSEGGPISSQLRQVVVPSLSMDHCVKEYGASSIDDTMICAGKKGVDSCQGDSGGPLVTKHTDGRWFQAGIVSWGYGCAEANHAGIYARVSSMCDFVQNTTGKAICQ